MRFDQHVRKVVLSGSAKEDILTHNKVFYIVEPLSAGYKVSKGGNSSVFKLTDPNTSQQLAIKISKFSIYSKKNRRFTQEVKAMKVAKKAGLQNVLEFHFNGQVTIEGTEYPYYVMELADKDLTQLMDEEIGIDQKKVIARDLMLCLADLEKMKLYHRDIKPDNLFFVQGILKIGDLGLSKFREEEIKLDDPNEKIGPYGWLSPEAMNKVLCEGTQWEAQIDCEIDHRSDLFQAGKVIWYIFNGNIPIGQLLPDDFLCAEEEVFNLLFNMLSYNKASRGELTSYVRTFNSLG